MDELEFDTSDEELSDVEEYCCDDAWRAIFEKAVVKAEETETAQPMNKDVVGSAGGGVHSRSP